MLRDILIDIKTYLSVKIKNPRRFPGSRIESFIPGGLRIGKSCTIKKNVLITGSLEHIGDFSYIGDGSSIYECSSIGKFCSISHGVKIGLTNHPLDHISTHTLFYDKAGAWVSESTFDDKAQKKCVIENDVLISANAMILNGVTLGTGAVVGAGSFVNKDVPPYAIVAGTPAKIIRYRFDEATIARLLASKWWELPPEKLKALAAYFSSPNEFLKHINRP